MSVFGPPREPLPPEPEDGPARKVWLGLVSACKYRDRNAIWAIEAALAEGVSLDGYEEVMPPILIAARTGNVQACRELARAGAKLDVFSRIGEGPVATAAVDGQVECIEELVRLGCGVDQRWAGGWTPLMFATVMGKVESMRALLVAGADLGAVDGKGKTALHLAASHHRVEIVERLLDAGADPSRVDHEGRSPLDTAKRRAQANVAAYLEMRLRARQESEQIASELGAFGMAVAVGRKPGL